MKIRAKVVDTVFNVLELVSSVFSFVSKLRRKKTPPPEEPFPLRRDALRPPPLPKNEPLKRR